MQLLVARLTTLTSTLIMLDIRDTSTKNVYYLRSKQETFWSKYFLHQLIDHNALRFQDGVAV
jgi:hypothetical protein